MPLRLPLPPQTDAPPAAAPHALLAEATGRHLLGDLSGAEGVYLTILGECAEDTDALFLLGTLYLQAGSWDQALARFGRLVTLQPNHVEGYFHMGFAYQEKGLPKEAEQCYQAALLITPQYALARLNLASLYLAQDQPEAALAQYQALAELEPAQAAHRVHCGLLLQRLGQPAAAEQALLAALELDAEHSGALLALAALLVQQKRYDEAELHYLRVMSLAPDLPEAVHGLGNLRLKQYRYADAEALLSRAVTLQAEQPELLSDLSVALRKLARLNEAETCLRQALAQNPEHADAHFNLGIVLLQQGRFEEGWNEFEWRFRIQGRAPIFHDQPLWDGAPLAGKTILVQAEQGFGDTFQFLRYLPLLKAQGARVMFECQAGLKRLLKQCAYIDYVFERTPSLATPADYDVYAPLMSLPRLFGADIVPPPDAYLKPEPWTAQRWQARLASDSNFKVGLVWSGKPTNEDNPNRLCPLAQFAMLAEVPGVSLYSLQKGAAADEFASQPWADPLKDLQYEIDDFADTAAAICALDLVITVDTSVAHLAGALGRPVWVLLAYSPDWRWLMQRDDSPWYPGMRLFRQQALGVWGAPMERAAAALRPCAAKPRGVQSAAELAALAYPPLVLVSLHRARKARRRGDAGLARHDLEAVLQSLHNHAEANCLLGALLLEQGEEAAAQAPLALAQMTWPEHPPLLRLLGLTAQALGDDANATRFLERALALGNEECETWHAFGESCQRLGLWAEAMRACRKALDWRPDWAELADELGTLLQGMGEVEKAIACYQRALRAKPDMFQAHFHLGNALFGAGRVAEAEAVLLRAVALKPEHAPVRNNLGVVLKSRDRLEEAESHLLEAVRLDPGYSEAHNNLGNVLARQDKLEAAERAFRQALASDPTNAQAYNNLGITLQATGALDTALQCYDTAVMLRPKFAEAHWNRALALLLHDEYEEGWREYEWGFEAGTRQRLALGSPLWPGSAEPHKTLLVHTEQGFGDTLQFMRLLPLARQRVGRLVVCCQAPLAPLLEDARDLLGVDAVVSEEAPLPAHDFHCALMSLPQLLGAGREQLHMKTPYLRTDPARVARFAALTGDAGLKAGLVWAGLPTHQNDRRRSCGITPFKRLLDIPGVHFFSLQKGPAEVELEEVGGLVHHLAPRLADFADTAAALSQLDLLITVDTAVAHLAGALGKPVWLLLPFAPDWRWGAHRATTPWYPGMRLFRQPRRGQWGPVLDQVKAELMDLARVRR
ncbi:MAG: hypothetical protein A2Z01_00430 [Betaproteobacteria bacterium RBG_16_58_11]|nr:MAG: hypothetical protein A2Z01_00430 [Betaproteobacteria bacterium RBG_16_58_11]